VEAIRLRVADIIAEVSVFFQMDREKAKGVQMWSN